MRKLVLNNIGIGFTKLENLKEVIDNVEIIQEIEQDGVEEGIAVLKKNMSSKATLELVNMIKQYYNIS